MKKETSVNTIAAADPNGTLHMDKECMKAAVANLIEGNGNITLAINVTLNSIEWGYLTEYGRKNGMGLDEVVSRALWEQSGIDSLQERDACEEASRERYKKDAKKYDAALALLNVRKGGAK